MNNFQSTTYYLQNDVPWIHETYPQTDALEVSVIRFESSH